ncbi:MAG: 4'-phosphopantetheinyl transferase family protein [Pseudonocardiaceae bacterium]
MPAAVQSAIEVWWDQPGPRYLAHVELLDAPEKARFQAYQRDQDRLNFLAARVITKQVLASRTETTPERIHLVSDCPQCGRPHGKPRPRTEVGQFELSIAHCAGLVAVAISTAHPVGVDVEPLPSVDRMDLLADLVPQVFAPAERPYLAGLDELARAECVIRYWTRKEAALKATGDGLSIDPTGLILSPPGRRPELIEWPGDPAERPALTLEDLPLHADYAAALAVLGGLDTRPAIHRASPLRSEPQLRWVRDGW